MRCPQRFQTAVLLFVLAFTTFSNTAQITVQSSVTAQFVPDSMEKVLPLVVIDADRYNSRITCGGGGCGWGYCTASRAAFISERYTYTDRYQEPRRKYFTNGLPMNDGLYKGMSSLPPSWLESFTVYNIDIRADQGFESPSGLIQAKLWKGGAENDLKAGVEINHLGELTSDVMGAYRINDALSGNLLYHVGYMGVKHDFNNDGFLDVPLTEDMRIMNSWKVQKHNVSDKIHSLRSEFGVQYTYLNETSGEKDFAPQAGGDTLLHYGAQLQTNHLTLFSKNMITLDKGIIRVDASATMDDQQGFYGTNNYSGESNDLWMRALFTASRKSAHTYTGGVSYQASAYNESLQSVKQQRTEHLAGAFGKYQYNKGHWQSIAGMRLDYHNLYGLLWSPSVNVTFFETKYNSVSAGIDRRYRVPKALNENLAFANSARTFELTEEVQPERSWNLSAGATHVIARTVFCRLHYEHIEFQNKLVADLDEAQQVVLYNSNTRSYEDRVTFYTSYQWKQKLQASVRYTFSNVMTAYKGGMEKEPFVPNHAFTASLAYSLGGVETPTWEFALGGQFIGQQRLPETGTNPEVYRREDHSPSFFLLNARVCKFYKKWEFYAGAGNILNVRMNNPVIAADQPFSPYFDASMNWGPVAGAKAYAGVVFALNPVR